MEKNYSGLSSFFKPGLFLVVFLFFSIYSSAQGDLIVNNNTTISAVEPPEEVDNVIYNNSSKLTITGTLIVNGIFNMDQNNASLELGEGARLIVYGNFIAHNKVNITLQKDSYLFVYGDFSKGGASNQDLIIIDNAKIYILGNGDNWGGNFTSCGGSYNGTTKDTGDTCDFGNEEDYENNQDDFPDDLVEQLNCYNLSGIANQTACLNGNTTFSVASSLNIDQDEVNFKWQKKISDTATWEDIPEATNVEYTITEVTAEMESYSYRVVVKPKVPANSNCKISISRKVSILIASENTWTGGDDTNWNNTNNWSCNTLPTLETNVLVPENLPSDNYPVINAGANALAKDLTIENNARVIVNDNWLSIAGDLTNSGVLNTATGSISFEGSNVQTIPAAAFQNNRIRNLRIDNTSGVTSEAVIEVTGELLVRNGNFNAGNDLLTLISNAAQTALIDGSGNGQVVGTVKMQRYLDVAFGYKYFSAPFQSSVVDDFNPFMDFADPTSGFPHVYRYNENRNVTINETAEDATGWEVHTGNLNIAEGYALNFGDTNNTVLVEISGEVNNGPITAKTLLNNHREYTRGFHLVGNPYPSPIDWDATEGWTRDNLDNAIYFFTASDTDQYTGSYTSYVNEVSTEDTLVDGRSSNVIPSMQGFFIKVSTSVTEDLVTGTFGMDNRVRTNDFAQEFLKAPERDPKQLLRFTAGFKDEREKDAMIIYFSPYSTLNFEKEFDAHKLMNSDPNIPNFYNITSDKKELAINAIPFPALGNYNKIPLGIKAKKSGKMSIALSAMENLSSNFNIYLIDHSRSIGQNLSQKPEYTFDITEGTHNSRFELMFSEEKITNPAIAFNEPFYVEVINNEVVVKLNLEDNQEGILQASTMIGQILQIKKGRGQEHIVFNGITSDGVYIINLILGEARYSKKVIIKK